MSEEQPTPQTGQQLAAPIVGENDPLSPQHRELAERLGLTPGQYFRTALDFFADQIARAELGDLRMRDLLLQQGLYPRPREEPLSGDAP